MNAKRISYFLAPAAVLIAGLALTIKPFAQDTVQSDPPDSGYVSAYLANLDRASAGEDENGRARLEAMRESRGTNKGFGAYVLQQANLQRQLYANLLPGAAAPAGVPSWTSQGPNKTNHIQNGVTLNVTDSGRPRSILVHPTNPDIVYVLTSSGGLWKTTSFTQNKPNWIALTDAVSTTSGGAAALGHNPNTIYVGLGDPFFGNGLTGGVMIKSTDGGATWSAGISLPTASTIRDVKVDFFNGHDIVLVASDFGLYVSMDDGATYNLALDAALFHTNQAGPILTGMWSFAKTSQGWLASTQSQFIGLPDDGTGALVMSADHGATWNAISNPGNVFTGAGRTTLGVGLPGDNVAYAFAADTGDNVQLDLFRSNDGGQSWAALGLAKKTPANPNPDQPNMDIMEGQAFYNQMLLVDSNDANRNTVYIGGQLSSAKSTDGGVSWRIIANWLAQFGLPYVHADYHAAALSNLTKNPTIIFGSDGGVFTTIDGGNTFDDSRNTGLVTILGYTIGSTPTHPASTSVGTQDNGTFVRWGDNDIWEQPVGGDGFGTGWSQANDAVVLGSVEFSLLVNNFKRDPSRQAKWNLAIGGINRTFAVFNTTVATPSASADTTGLSFFTYTSRQIYRTNDGGVSWTDIGHTTIPQKNPPNIPPSPGIGKTRIFRDTPHGIGVSPTANGLNTVAVVCNGGFVVSTHDGGATWHQAGLIGTVPNWQGFNSNVEWADDSTLYLASESPVPGGRIAKSTDGGVTFSRADNGIPDVPVNRVLVSQTNPNTLYAATFLGVYRSTNGGASWTRFGAGLPFVEVRDLYMPPDGSFLRVSTFGRGVWEITP
jgi:photosystem II stability/assembly factor-like uncharacterized protein